MSGWELLGIYTIVSIVCWGATSHVLAHVAKEPFFRSDAANMLLVAVSIVLIVPAMAFVWPAFLAIHLVGADPHEFPNRDTPEGQMVYAALPLIGFPLLGFALVMRFINVLSRTFFSVDPAEAGVELRA